MRIVWSLALFLAFTALAASLKLPPEAPAGRPVTIEGEDLPPGTYALEVEGPAGTEVLSADATSGRFTLDFKPPVPGKYVFRLALPEGPLEGVLNAVLPSPRLTPEGLDLGFRTLPLPEPERWLGPVVEEMRVYVARGLLVLEVDRLNGEAVRHYPPNVVEKLLPGPELLLADGRRLGLSELEKLPFEGPDKALPELWAVEAALGPYTGKRPFWSLFGEETLDPAAYKAAEADLFARGHRPDLAWDRGPLIERLMARAEKGDAEAARFLSEATPGFPGAGAFFRALAPRFDGALRARLAAMPEALKASFAYPYPALFRYLVAFFLLAWLALFIKGLFYPGRTLFVFASLGAIERVLGLFLLLAAGAAFLAYGVTEAGARTPVRHATLSTESFKTWLKTQPETPETQALLALAKGEVPGGDWTFARLAQGRFLEALSKDPGHPRVKEALGLGGDAFTAAFLRLGQERGFYPNERELMGLVAAAWARRLVADPLKTYAALPAFPHAGVAYLALVLFGLLLLYTLAGLALPRPQGPAPRLSLFVLALIPGVEAFREGVGLLLFALGVLGAWLAFEGVQAGLYLLFAAYLLHWGWIWARRRP